MTNNFLKKLCITAIFLISNTVANAAGSLPVQQKKPWLFFTYIAGDNSLSGFILQNLKDMIKSYSDNVHIVAFVSAKTQEEGKFSKMLYVTKDGVAQDGDTLHDLDSGSVETATMAILWALKTFPADKVVINFWDHGSGILNPRNKPVILRGVCFDDTTGNYLTDLDLMSILQEATKAIKKPVDIVSFDACLMAGVEIAETLRQYATYLVASEETISGLGFEYAFILSALKNANLKPLELAICMNKDYDLFYHSHNDDYTLSATDLRQIAPLTNLINKLADMLKQFIEADQHNIVKKTIKKFAFSQTSLRFEQEDYIDLANFLYLLNKNIINLRLNNLQKLELQKLINALLVQLKIAVVTKVSSPRFQTCGGLSIYLPLIIDDSYTNLYWSTQSSWLGFLKALLN